MVVRLGLLSAACGCGRAQIDVGDAGACGGSSGEEGGAGFGESCGDTRYDHENCGRCQHACAADEWCSNGTCFDLSCQNSLPSLGCPCSPDNTLACNGSAQTTRLICSLGRWMTNGAPCPAGYHCAQASGACQAIIAECEMAGAGRSFCEAVQDGPSTTTLLCDEDWVSTMPAPCRGICKDGVCEAPFCGDGRQQADEECDDGNREAIDGCENDCTASRVVSLALGNGFTCALAKGGFVRCWGDNESNQLGLGDSVFRQDQAPFAFKLADGTTSAGPIDLGGEALEITAGVDHACALLADGTARCWGENSDGQLGLGHTKSQTQLVPRRIGAVQLGSARRIVSLSAGVRHTCAALDDGTVSCWGQNGSGELGLGHTQAVSSTRTPEESGVVSLGGEAVRVGAGNNFSCALMAGGSVRCWGTGARGQLGTGRFSEHGSVGDDELPSNLGALGRVPLQQDTAAVELQVSSTHACVLLSNLKLECWGMNSTGAIGIGASSDVGKSESPAIYGGPVLAQNATIRSFAVGFGSTCALIAGQGLRCWGLNPHGQAGYDNVTSTLGTNNETVPALLPNVDVGPGRSVRRAFAGWSHTCAILDNDDIKCWGWNDRGQLGFGTVSSSPDYIGGTASTTPDKLAPIRVFGP